MTACAATTAAHDAGPVRLYLLVDSSPFRHVWMCEGCASRYVAMGLAIVERRDTSEIGQRRRSVVERLRIRTGGKAA